MSSANRERMNAARGRGSARKAEAVVRKVEAIVGKGGAAVLTIGVAAATLGVVFLSPGCSSSSTEPPAGPARITDLRAESMGSAGVMLRWSAPRAGSGAATRYDIRLESDAIADSNWAAADTVHGEPIPSTPGATDSCLVGGLDGETTYHFAIRSVDSASRISSISNDVSVHTIYGAPKDIAAVIANFQNAWINMNYTEYARLFAPTYTFVFAPQDVGGPNNIPATWGLADDLLSASHLFSRTAVNHDGYVADRVRLSLIAGPEILNDMENWTKVVLSNIFLTVECHQVNTGDPLWYLVEGDQAYFWFAQEGESWHIIRWEDKPITGLAGAGNPATGSNPVGRPAGASTASTTFGEIKGLWW